MHNPSSSLDTGPVPAGHPAVPAPTIGVLLVNLGSPDAPTPAAVKRYLGEFLSDRRVVELPPIVWQPILRGIVLNTRPRRSAANYAKVWADDSPLRAITVEQTAALRDAFGPGVIVDYAMRYGNPAMPARLAALRDAGVTRVLIAPLYPQYCAATTATVIDHAFATFAGWRWQPAVRTLPPYHDHPRYIAAMAANVREQLAALSFAPELVLMSFHGMPAVTLRKGDPYHCHCRKTGRLLADALGLADSTWRVTFQSRFGRQEWLQPYTDPTLAALPGEGVRKVAVVAPGFSADCLETLEELALTGRETFEHAGGTDFAYLPCLNATPSGVEMLRALIMNELAGWVSAP